MKTEIINTKDSQIPNVGECFCINDNNVFIRIDDECGKRAIPTTDTANTFFYCLNLLDGQIKWIHKSTIKDIKILKPVGGIMKFEFT